MGSFKSWDEGQSEENIGRYLFNCYTRGDLRPSDYYASERGGCPRDKSRRGLWLLARCVEKVILGEVPGTVETTRKLWRTWLFRGRTPGSLTAFEGGGELEQHPGWEDAERGGGDVKEEEILLYRLIGREFKRLCK